MGKLVALVMLLIAAPAAAQQSINVAFGSDAPSSSYAAAGAAGTWNSISGIAGMSFKLVAIDGSPSDVSVSQSPTTTLIAGSADPSVSGDDAKLLDHGLVTTGAETCLSFVGFRPGTYEVLVYAWSPNQPTVKSRTRQDEAPTTIDVGGAWTGSHAEGVTYARYVVTVDSSGVLPAHSGLAPMQPSAALNGIQIRPLAATAADAGIGGDAGGGGGGGAGETADAGTGETTPHRAGCATSDERAGWLVVGLVLVSLRRRRR